LETNNAATLSAVEAAAQASIAAWIAGLPIGGTLAISKIDALAHAVDASVISVLNVTINGSAADITAPAAGVLLPLSVRVN
jgi:uncharacterized phage protein gp47/JayE